MQGAVDSTALMLSKDAATLTPDQVTTKATAYFNALFNRTDVNGIQIMPSLHHSGRLTDRCDGNGHVFRRPS